jgi:eukaryotic-like serine/threonine-protein kinase
MTEAMAPTGTRVLGGRYALREILGTGGMATVWRATDDVLGRDVAVKMLNAEYASDAGFLARFNREARNVAAVSSSRIVAVYDRGIDGKTPYIVMELVSGPTLRQMLDDGGALPPAEAIRVATAVCEALEAAHAAGIIHRDIKPANIVLSGREVKVLDFGIARTEYPVGGTRTHGVLGTAAYLSPEQASGQPVGPQSDLYSLGCVLFEMLTGEAPFTADSEVGVAYRQVHDDPGPPSARRPGLSAKIDSLTASLLAKDAAERPIGAVGARAALAAAFAPDQTAVLDAVPGRPPGLAPPPSAPAVRGRGPLTWRPSETVLGMALVAALAALVVVLVTSGPSPVRTAAPPVTPVSGQASQQQSQPPSPSVTPSSSATATTTPADHPASGTPPVAKASGALVSALQTGMTDGQVSQQAGQNLFNQLQQLLFNTPRDDAQQVEQQYAQLVEIYDQYRSQGQITGSAALALRQDMDALGTALGTS